MAIILANLPMTHANNVRSRYFTSEVFTKCFPLVSTSDARGSLVVSRGETEVHLFGSLKTFVLEDKDLFLSRLRGVLRKFFGAEDDSISIPPPASPKSASAASTMLATCAPLFEDDNLDRISLYTDRVGDQVAHGIIVSGILGAKRFTRGYVSLSLIPNYDFGAWKAATLQSYDRFKEADGYKAMMKVVDAAESVFNRSSAVRSDYLIFENRVLPCSSRFWGRTNESGVTGTVQLAHIDLCAGHEFLYAPMIVPVRADRNLSFDVGQQDGVDSSGEVNMVTKPVGVNRYATIFTTRPKSDEDVMSHSSTAAFKVNGVLRPAPTNFTAVDPKALQLLKLLMPDLRVLADVSAFADTDYKAWHESQIALAYRDADVADTAPAAADEETALKWIASARSQFRGKRNLERLPALTGNTLALYSYIAGEAMGEYETWSEEEFLHLLDTAYLTWQPSKTASAVDAINAMCDVLGCPKVVRALYEAKGDRIFASY